MSASESSPNTLCVPPKSVDIVVLGAGPAGLETLLAAREVGFSAVCLEAGEVGQSLRRWQDIRMFSPWSHNASARGREALARVGTGLPDDIDPDAPPPTGREYLEQYLLPISRLPEVASCLYPQTRAAGVSRQGLLKTDAIGSPERSATPFQILWEQAGREGMVRAPIVIDATGVYENPSPSGNGGLWAPGERSLSSSIERWIPTADTCRSLADRRTLVIGSGYSAATAILALIDARDPSDTAGATGSIHWVYRGTDGPIQAIENDALPERAQLTERVKALADDPPPELKIHDGSSVISFPGSDSASPNSDAEPASSIQVEVERLEDGQRRILEIDHVISLTGYRPDPSLLRELQVHHCWASDGLMKLSAQLLTASGGDCLAVQTDPSQTLANPEPNLFVLGSKSYGRFSQYLLRSGHEQVEAVFSTFLSPKSLQSSTGSAPA